MILVVIFPHLLTSMVLLFPVSNKRRADDKHDQGHVTSKRQRRVPSAKGAVALTTMRSSASEPYQETALACSTPRKAGVDSPGPGGKSKYTQSDDVDIGSCNECDDGGGMLKLP